MPSKEMLKFTGLIFAKTYHDVQKACIEFEYNPSVFDNVAELKLKEKKTVKTILKTFIVR